MEEPPAEWLSGWKRPHLRTTGAPLRQKGERNSHLVGQNRERDRRDSIHAHRAYNGLRLMLPHPPLWVYGYYSNFSYQPMKTLSLSLAVTFLFVTLATNRVAAEEIEVSEYKFSFEAPLATKTPLRPMTKGGVVIPSGEGKTLDANFYFFGTGQGGSVEANVARWIGQFEGEPKVEKEESTHGDRKVIILKAKGTYLDGRPFGPKTPKEGYALLGAIIEGGVGPVFVKLYGPEAEVAATEAAFKKLVTSPFGEKKE